MCKNHSACLLFPIKLRSAEKVEFCEYMRKYFRPTAGRVNADPQIPIFHEKKQEFFMRLPWGYSLYEKRLLTYPLDRQPFLFDDMERTTAGIVVGIVPMLAFMGGGILAGNKLRTE